MQKIDYGIRAFVHELNQRGYKTLYSCAGHKNVVDRAGKIIPDKTGYILIDGNYTRSNDLKRIARKYVDGIVIKATRRSYGPRSKATNRLLTVVATVIEFKSKNLSGWGGC